MKIFEIKQLRARPHLCVALRRSVNAATFYIDFFVLCHIYVLRRRMRCFNGSADKKRSGGEGDALRRLSSGATKDSVVSALDVKNN